MNEELAEPYLSKISQVWEHMFGAQITTVLNNHGKDISTAISNVLKTFADGKMIFKSCCLSNLMLHL